MKDTTRFHYDIIADIHGRHDKLVSLMARLGYASSTAEAWGDRRQSTR